MTQVMPRITISIPTEPERTRFYCVACNRCNAEVSGDFADVRVFVRCKKCGVVMEAKRG